MRDRECYRERNIESRPMEKLFEQTSARGKKRTTGKPGEK
jgi:hypothetical protein